MKGDLFLYVKMVYGSESNKQYTDILMAMIF